MTVDLEWARRNLPDSQALEAAAATREAIPDDTQLQRELIEFDSEAPEAAAFRAPAAEAVGGPGLDAFKDIDWPASLAPRPFEPPAGEELPKSDVLIVTWTVDEGHALSRVLTPGYDSKTDWRPYTNNFDDFSKRMRVGCPARNYGRLGTYWCASIGERNVALFKSDSHMSQDGPDLVNADVWRQLISETQPRLVITTGTGGGIGSGGEVGDVVLSRFLSFDCQRQFERLNGHRFSCGTHPSLRLLEKARTLFRFNAAQLPCDNSRPPRTRTAQRWSQDIVTTDFFGFDTSDDHYGLQGKGALSEMGDAVLGMVCQEMEDPPAYIAVRNVSDPQISSAGLTLAQQTDLAATIYKTYGRWSSVCSAIVCWALAAAAD